MNILVVGSGAREQAIVAALHRSTHKPLIACCGTGINPAIKQMTTHYWVGDITDIAAITALAKEWKIDIAIIGPEAPLEKGLADSLWDNNIPTIGPKKSLAQIETSKAFARDLMQKHNIPGLPQYQTFKSIDGIETFLQQLGEGKYVIKANGLMAGKGVKVAGDHLHSFKEALDYCEEILNQQQTIVIEEKLLGQEFSLMCFCDGKNIIPMPIVQDHKRAYADDKGPNTGGMGSYSDVNHSLPFLTPEDVQAALQINHGVFNALNKELKDNYIGILYGSFIATRDGVSVIEFNARFGDPEALNVLSILESDFVTICKSLVNGDLSNEKVIFAPQATVCKYAVPNGYPDAPIKNAVIEICAVKNKALLYLAAVDLVDGKLIATGSRTAAYVGVSHSIPLAEEIAEKEVRAISGPLMHREDIGKEYLIEKRVDAMREIRGS